MSQFSTPQSEGTDPRFTVGVALDGAGWHPAAWREPGAQPDALFTAPYWTALAEAADAAGIDYLTLEDSLHVQGADLGSPLGSPADDTPPRLHTEIVEGRLDALIVASWIAPRTRRIGVIPTVTTTHTEPFHLATALQTLDFVSEGRAGWQLRFSPNPVDAAAFGRKEAPQINIAAVIAGEEDPDLSELIDEAADVSEVARGLWDSWEDDAIIRDVATGRFLDRDRVHHINFEGDRFSVAGPSIVPRSPQGQLPITLLAHAAPIYRLAAAVADVVFITPDSVSKRAGASRGGSAGEIVAAVRAAEVASDRASRGLAPLRIVADLVIGLDSAAESAADRLERLNGLAGAPYESDTRVFVGSAEDAADLIAEWQAAGVEGVRLRPLSLPADLTEIGQHLLPVLRDRTILTAADEPRDLRAHFGLAPAVNVHTASLSPSTEASA